MKTFIQFPKIWLRGSVTLGIFSAVALTSCTVQVGGYSENDGVYYDPSTDTLPEGTVYSEYGNQVGDEYQYGDDRTQDYQGFIPGEKRYGRYRTDNATDSDWGTYAGTDTYYSNFGNPYWGWGLGLGWGNRFGWRMGMNWGWGSPWMGFYDPFWYGGWYSPYYMGMNSWYGYYDPFWYGGGWGMWNQPIIINRIPMMRSGAVGRFGNSYNPNALRSSGNTSNGFRNGGTFRNGNNSNMQRNPSGFRNRNSGEMNRNNGFRNSSGSMQRPSGGFRNSTPAPSRNYQYESRPAPSYNSGGFRNSSGGVGGGGFRSGGGSTRSGGFR